MHHFQPVQKEMLKGYMPRLLRVGFQILRVKIQHLKLQQIQMRIGFSTQKDSVSVSLWIL